MFSRISFTLSKVLRFRSRRANKTQARSSVPPPVPPKDDRPTTEPAPPVINVASHTLLSLIAQSPTGTGDGVVSPPLSPIDGAQSPIIVISLDNAQPHVISARSSLSTLVDVETSDHLAVEQPSLKDKHVSFSEKTTRSSLRPPSTLPPRTKPKPKSRARRTPPPHPILLPDSVAPREWEDIPGDIGSAYIKPKGSKRPISLFSPRPTDTTTHTARAKSLRFSVPPKPRAVPRYRCAGTVPNIGALASEQGTGEALGAAHNKRRMSKRAFTVPASGTTVKEKRKSRWSQQMDMPETQEVLMALRDMN